MITRIFSLLAASSLTITAAQDILNFKNNDTLHGSFLSFIDSQTLAWKSPQANQAIEFKTNQLRKIIFQRGNPQHPLSHNGLITLVNGDIIPCEILLITEKSIKFRTDYMGDLDIPRSQVAHCSISSKKKEIIYSGPVLENEWKHIGDPSLEQQTSFEPFDTPQELDATPKIPTSHWQFSSFSWLNNGSAGAIALDNIETPKNFRVAFRCESMRSSPISFVFKANLNAQKITEETKKKTHRSSGDRITEAFGPCFTLRLHTYGTTLSYYYLDEKGTSRQAYLKPRGVRIAHTNSSQLKDSIIEIRYDDVKQLIAVYRDKNLVNLWSLEGRENLPTGNHIGFNANTSSSGTISRISNFFITHWNGVIDSPLSLDSPTTDTVILNNGTERFAGSITELDSDTLKLKGSFSNLEIPAKLIHSISFAKQHRAEPPTSKNNQAQFAIGYYGTLTAQPLESSPDTIQLKHPILGNITVRLDYLSAITYDPSASILDQWNTKLR